jgi:hypothetical protein
MVDWSIFVQKNVYNCVLKKVKKNILIILIILNFYGIYSNYFTCDST